MLDLGQRDSVSASSAGMWSQKCSRSSRARDILLISSIDWGCCIDRATWKLYLPLVAVDGRVRLYLCRAESETYALVKKAGQDH